MREMLPFVSIILGVICLGLLWHTHILSQAFSHNIALASIILSTLRIAHRDMEKKDFDRLGMSIDLAGYTASRAAKGHEATPEIIAGIEAAIDLRRKLEKGLGGDLQETKVEFQVGEGKGK